MPRDRACRHGPPCPPRAAVSPCATAAVDVMVPTRLVEDDRAVDRPALTFHGTLHKNRTSITPPTTIAAPTKAGRRTPLAVAAERAQMVEHERAESLSGDETDDHHRRADALGEPRHDAEHHHAQKSPHHSHGGIEAKRASDGGGVRRNSVAISAGSARSAKRNRRRPKHRGSPLRELGIDARLNGKCSARQHRDKHEHSAHESPGQISVYGQLIILLLAEIARDCGSWSRRSIFSA